MFSACVYRKQDFRSILAYGCSVRPVNALPVPNILSVCKAEEGDNAVASLTDDNAANGKIDDAESVIAGRIEHLRSVRFVTILYRNPSYFIPAPGRSGLVRAKSGNPAVFSSRVYYPQCPFSHGRIRILCSGQRPGYIQKNYFPVPCPESRKAEKQIFFRVSGYIQKNCGSLPPFWRSAGYWHTFFLYIPCFTAQTEQKGENLRNSGVLRNNYFVYTLPDQMPIKICRPAREGAAANRSCTPRGNHCRIWTASISRCLCGQSGVM